MTALRKLYVRGYALFTCSPHAKDLAGFARWMLERAYTKRYTQHLVFATMRVLEGSDLPAGRTWTTEQLDPAFRPYWHRGPYRSARHTFGVFLRSIGRLAPPPPPAPCPQTSALKAYEDFLANVHGLLPITIDQHRAEAHALMQHALPRGKSLEHLSASAIEQHIKQRAQGLSCRSLRTSIGCLRAFLRYCHDHNLIKKPLHQLEQRVGFREDRPARALDWKLIQKLLRSIDRTDRSGWRDFMMLHLMAHYGLRPGEITRLRVDSIHWEDRTLLVEQPKIRAWLTLPLMEETLRLLRRYLKEGRRRRQRSELFSAAVAPYGPVRHGTINQVLKTRAHKAGLLLPHAFPYALRHSFAMRLFAQGVGIKAIGDLMGHSSLVSTFVYLRIQTKMLRGVALPVPLTIAPLGGAA